MTIFALQLTTSVLENKEHQRDLHYIIYLHSAPREMRIIEGLESLLPKQKKNASSTG
jgi:hypothetical protein